MEDLAPPSFGGLATGVARGGGAENWADLFDDALNDLVRLIEEYRFEVATAGLYITALGGDLRSLNENARTQAPGGIAPIGLVPKAQAMLADLLATPTPPSFLLERPDARIPGVRLLGGWWAAQLIDSALLRGLSALDRVATLLTAIDGQPMRDNRAPAFRRDEIRRLKRWRGTDTWAKLLQLFKHPLYEYVKQYRDGFVHRRRQPMELHGDHMVGLTDDSGGVNFYLGSEPGMHLGLGVEYFRLVIRPAITLGGELIRSVSPTTE